MSQGVLCEVINQYQIKQPQKYDSYHHYTEEIKNGALLALAPFVAFCLLGLCLFSSLRVISSYCTSILVSLGFFL